MSKNFLIIALFCLIQLQLNQSYLIISADEDIDIFKAQIAVNEFPIIGILAEEILYSLDREYPNQYHSYIAASYVKFIEGGGARVVPIW